MADVLIVGGGIIGCALGIELAGRGVSVLLLERHQPGTGATGASAGMLVPEYEAEPGTPFFRLGVESLNACPGFVDRLEDLADWKLDFRRDGMLVANPAGAASEGAGRRRVERLDPSEAG